MRRVAPPVDRPAIDRRTPPPGQGRGHGSPPGNGDPAAPEGSLGGRLTAQRRRGGWPRSDSSPFLPFSEWSKPLVDNRSRDPRIPATVRTPATGHPDSTPHHHAREAGRSSASTGTGTGRDPFPARAAGRPAGPGRRNRSRDPGPVAGAVRCRRPVRAARADARTGFLGARYDGALTIVA